MPSFSIDELSALKLVFSNTNSKRYDCGGAGWL